ncbi:hypothetical protein D3C77_662170 [compost metagenome]
MTMSMVRTRVTKAHFGSLLRVRLPHRRKPSSRITVVMLALLSRLARQVASPSRYSIARLVPVMPTNSLFDGEAQKPYSLSVQANRPATQADAGASRVALLPVSQYCTPGSTR